MGTINGSEVIRWGTTSGQTGRTPTNAPVQSQRFHQRRARRPQRKRVLKLPQFQEWAHEFRTKLAFVAGVLGEPPDKQPVHAILDKFKQLKLVRGTHEQLQRNALYACYQAAHAGDPDQHSSAKERKEFRESYQALTGHLVHVNQALAFIHNHATMAQKGLAIGSVEPGNKPLPMDKAGAALAELQQLLEQYRGGLEEIQDFDHPLHITSVDFWYPPFEFSIPIYNWHNKKKNLPQVGLIFHLTYLFKYFTCPDLPENIDARFNEWRLEFYGPMLRDCGKAHTELVAPLVNAVFPKAKLSPLQVQNRLKELVSRQKSKGAKLRNQVRFIGWALVDDVPTT